MGGFIAKQQKKIFLLLKETFSEKFLKNHFFLSVKNI